MAVQKDDLTHENTVVRARYVFAGAGGGSLRLLQKAGIPEIAGYAGMPVSGNLSKCLVPRTVHRCPTPCTEHCCPTPYTEHCCPMGQSYMRSH